MKFCPNCGLPLDGKTKCECGYNVETNEVDKEMNQQYEDTIKGNYERQCNVMPMGLNSQMGFGMSKEDALENARKMGLDSSISEEQLWNQMNQPIFNRENDNLSSKELLEIMREYKDIQKDETKE